MTYSRPVLDAELIRDEGLKLHVYLDTAKPPRRSIGVGRNLDDVGITPAETTQTGLTLASCLTYGITRAEALILLGNDIARCEAALDRRLPWWRSLDDVRQRALLNLCFNLGINSLCGFTTTLKAIQIGAWTTAKTALLKSKYAGQVGDRAKRLAAMIETGAVA